jgi:hypothetical protein
VGWCCHNHQSAGDDGASGDDGSKMGTFDGVISLNLVALDGCLLIVVIK